MIESALKLGAKTYDGTDDPEAGYLWLDRVSILAIYGDVDMRSFHHNYRKKVTWTRGPSIGTVETQVSRVY